MKTSSTYLDRPALALGLLVCCLAAAFGQAPASPHAALDSTVDLSCKDAPLASLLATIADNSQISIVTDDRSLQQEWLDIDAVKVTTTLKSISLGDALDQLLEPHALTWIVRHGVVLITTDKAANEHYFDTRVYQVTQNVPVDRRARSIRANVDRSAWVVSGGKGDLAPLPPKFIVILQSPAVHRHVAQRFRRSIVPVSRNDRSTIDRQTDSDPWRTPASIDCQKLPMPRVLVQIIAEHDLMLRVNRAALTAAGIEIDDLSVSLVAKCPTLGSLLSLLTELTHDELQWVTEGNVVEITTKQAAGTKLVDMTFDTRRITDQVDGKLMSEAIEYAVSPASWEFNGGAGRIELLDDGKLKVRQSQPVCRQLQTLFSDLDAGLKN